MFQECLASLPARLASVDICPPRADFDAQPGFVRERRRALAESALTAPLSALTASDWRLFFETGDRAKYEEKYFSRRRRLVDLTCGALECPDDAARFTAAILDTVWAICEESAWQLPPHNTYIRDAPQLPWPDVERPVVDLFAAETGALLACCAAALGDILPGEIHARIKYEVSRRVMAPYFRMHFWWMGSGDEPMCNWTVWCTQNVLLCALALPFSEETRRGAVTKAAQSVDFFLKDYGTDGCCSEGAQYYGHAGLCLFGCLALLCAAAPGAFDALWGEEKIKNIAAYIHRVHIGGARYVNFADCSPLAGRRGAREYAFALAAGNDSMARFAARDWRESYREPAPDGDVARINLWYQLLETRYAAAMARDAAQPPLPAPADCALASVGVYIARRGAWFLAAKAGCNDDSHNHNDTGSVILYKDGAPFLIDVGVGTYTKQTFSPERYSIWTMQSGWHNLPTFGGVQQEAGAAYCARDVAASFEPEAARVSMELSAAWPESAKLTRYVRDIRLTRDGLTLTDSAEGGYPDAFLSLMLCEKPAIDGGRVAVGSIGTITARGMTGDIAADEIPVTDARLRLAWPETLWRVRIPFGKTLKTTIS